MTTAGRSTGRIWPISKFVLSLKPTVEMMLLWRRVTAAALSSDILGYGDRSRFETQLSFEMACNYVYFHRLL